MELQLENGQKQLAEACSTRNYEHSFVPLGNLPSWATSPLSGNLSSFLSGFELLREGVDLASFSPTGYCG